MREAEIDADEINFAKTPLDAATVRAIVEAAGGVAAVLNTRHAHAKAHGWAERPPGVAAFVEAVGREPNLLRRPILIKGKTVLVGYDKSNRERWGDL